MDRTSDWITVYLINSLVASHVHALLGRSRRGGDAPRWAAKHCNQMGRQDVGGRLPRILGRAAADVEEIGG